MGEHNSPRFADGIDDGTRDCMLIAMCPPSAPLGMNPEHAWSVMYQRGYHRMWDNAVPHYPCKNCRKDGQEEQ